MRPNDQRNFIHKKIGKFASGLVRTGLGVVGGLGIPVVSGVARGARSILRGGSRSPAFVGARAAQIARGRVQQSYMIPPQLPQSGPMRTNVVAQQAIQQIAAALPAGQCPKGFHANRSSYNLKDGTRVEEGTRCVRNRRRNPDNGTASMRAARRLLGRKKHQDRIDRALAAIAPRRHRRPAKPAALGRQTIVAT